MARNEGGEVKTWVTDQGTLWRQEGDHIILLSDDTIDNDELTTADLLAMLAELNVRMTATEALARYQEYLREVDKSLAGEAK